MHSWTKNFTVAAFKKRYKKDKTDPITLWQTICEELHEAQKRSNAIQKEKAHPILENLEELGSREKLEKLGPRLTMLTMAIMKKNYESRIKKIPQNFKDAIKQCQ